MNIVIIEDHSVLLHGLIEILEEKLDSKSIIGFCSPTKAFDHIDWSVINLVILDLEFKNNESGLKCCANLRSKYPHLRILAYTSHKIFPILNQIRKSGFNSYVCKDGSVKELLVTIIEIMNRSSNSFFESRSFLSFKQQSTTVENSFFTSDYERKESLTPTEMKVCEYISENLCLDNSKLADNLNMKLNTLKKHITNIYKKLGVHSKEGVLLYIRSNYTK